MYVFEDRGGEQPRPNAGRARRPSAARTSNMEWRAGPSPFGSTPRIRCFATTGPRKGRYRQHTQFDCEVLGSTDPLVDAEVIEVLWRLYDDARASSDIERSPRIDRRPGAATSLHRAAEGLLPSAPRQALGGQPAPVRAQSTAAARQQGRARPAIQGCGAEAHRLS